jgi:hypothetical protein
VVVVVGARVVVGEGTVVLAVVVVGGVDVSKSGWAVVPSRVSPPQAATINERTSRIEAIRRI